jgi:hypothetical protein
MKRSAAAIAAIFSRLGVGRAPSLLVRVSLRYAQRADNSDQKLAPTISGSNKLVLRNVKAAAIKVRVQLKFDAHCSPGRMPPPITRGLLVLHGCIARLLTRSSIESEVLRPRRPSCVVGTGELLLPLSSHFYFALG